MQAPLAGGPSTPALAAAVGEAGGLGFLAAGYKTRDAVAEDLAALRGLTDRPFGVNLFAPPAPAAERADVERYAASWAPRPSATARRLGEPRHDDDGWDAKLALLGARARGGRVVHLRLPAGRRRRGRSARRRAARCG